MNQDVQHDEQVSQPASDGDGTSIPPLQEAPTLLELTLARIDNRLGAIEARIEQSTLARPALALPQVLGEQNGWFPFAALATAILILFLRLVNLEQLQNEFYGDIALLYEYLVAIRAGHWPTYFTLSTGPLYHYLITPIVALTGLSYYGIKLASVVVSLGALVATYALARRLIDDHFALLATCIAGVSSWLLIFSRLGNSQILIPVLTASASWLALRAIQRGGSADIVACAVVSALGLYLYPQTFILPFVSGLTLLCLRWLGMMVRWADLWRFVVVTFLCALPFAWIVSRDPANFFSGYIGAKIVSDTSPFVTLLGNIGRGLLAFHIHGDSSFRSNPADLPHLDPISGLLFLAGVVFWLRPNRRRLSILLFLPLLLLQVPSLLVLSQPQEVPSASRTLGAAPFAYILVASGLWWLALARRPTWPRWFGPLAAGVLLVAIVLLNAQRYFRDYISGLPYQNTPVGRLVANYVDSLPVETKVYMVGCCWQDAMPDPKSVQYAMAHPDQLTFIEPEQVTCDWLQFQPAATVLIWTLQTPLPSVEIEPCKAWLPAQLYTSKTGLPVFYAASLHRELAGDSNNQPSSPDDAQLESQLIDIQGQTFQVHYSPLDIGEIANIFDGNDETLMRGRDANPLVIVLQFASPRTIHQISLTLATMPHAQITVELTDGSGNTTSFARDFIELEGAPVVDLPFEDGPVQVQRLRVEIRDLAPRPDEAPHIHVRELRMQ
jgi:4-amino-4-deoxy-L-arabinose transferase-like glycosyltransferase